MLRPNVPKYKERLERYIAAGFWRPETLDSVLDSVVATYGDKIAVIDAYGSMSYRELRNQADRVTAQLSNQGIGRGDVVTVQLSNRREFCVMVYALSRLGAVLHPLNVVYRLHEAERIMTLAGSKALISPGFFRNFDHAAMALELRSRIPTLDHVWVVGEGDRHGLDPWETLLEPCDQPVQPANRPEDICLILYTSGTTGTPKGVMHSHYTLLNSIRQLNQAYAVTSTDIGLDVLPVGLTYGFACILVILLPGGRLVFLEQYDAEETLSLMAHHDVTFFPAAPPHLFDLIVHMEKNPRADIRCLNTITVSGAAAPKELIEKTKQTFGCEIFPLLGMSECIGETTTPRGASSDLVATTVGIPFSGVEISIVDDAGLPCSTNVSGEVALRGPSQFLGYQGAPETTQGCHTADDWFLTGDLGVMGENGYLRITGRKKDLIIRGGLNIDPREIEELLIQHPLVNSAAVVGMPDPRLGERACACIIPKDLNQAPTLEELVSFLKDHGLANQKLPERLEVMREFPLTPTMKVRKVALREEIAAKLEAEGD